ncbi:hypothetical protein JTB14_013102 [Gonioctena quinquepunctata]|nr:hypothetical protein JTB14_013102 [Gonioctena quinquepunctata]
MRTDLESDFPTQMEKRLRWARASGYSIYTEPLDDGNDTECDSDASDEDEANLNRLGPNLLSAKCEFRLLDDMQENNEIDNPENILDSSKRNLDLDSRYDEPLAEYQRPKI